MQLRVGLFLWLVVGRAFAVGGAFAIRVSIGQTSTERRHVEQVWSTIAEIAQGLEPDNSR